MVTVRAGEMQGMAAVLQEIRGDVETQFVKLATTAGPRTVELLRDLTNEMRPPARKGTASRLAHLGHWGDVKGDLAKSYGATAPARTPGVVTFFLTNSAFYAAMLEARDNFWVLQGATLPGGPFLRALREAADRVDPDLRVVDV